MPLEKHLVVHLQEMYSTERDYCDFLKLKATHIKDQQLKSMVNQQIRDIGLEMDNLANCLSTFGAFPNNQLSSPLVQALQQEDQLTHQEIPNMSPADMDVHVAITDLSVGQMEIGLYQGMCNMALVLKQQEIADLLQQNLSHEQQDTQKVQQLLPNLINMSQQGSAAA